MECHVWVFVEHLQGQGPLQRPGQSVPMPNQPSREEVFPNVQPEPPWRNLQLFLLVLSLIPGSRARPLPRHRLLSGDLCSLRQEFYKTYLILVDVLCQCLDGAAHLWNHPSP